MYVCVNNSKCLCFYKNNLCSSVTKGFLKRVIKTLYFMNCYRYLKTYFNVQLMYNFFGVSTKVIVKINL